MPGLQLTFSLDEKTREKIIELAKRKDRSVSYVLRTIVTNYLKRGGEMEIKY